MLLGDALQTARFAILGMFLILLGGLQSVLSLAYGRCFCHFTIASEAFLGCFHVGTSV
jgi:hypothetical protein